MTRVLIVDDSATVRCVLRERLAAKGLSIVGEARDGAEACERVSELRPDVVVMDVEMPVMDGLEATRRIMDRTPTPIIVLSAHASTQEVFRTYDALAAGALDVCAKPTGLGPEAEIEWNRILRTIEIAASVRVMRLRSRAIAPVATTPSVPELAGSTPKTSPELVAIGASTGGPAALRQIFEGLGDAFPLPVLVALHINPNSVASIASWFDRASRLKVLDAADGETWEGRADTVFFAPPGTDIAIEGSKIRITPNSSTKTCIPSVDALFESVATHRGDRAVGVLLTGMGDDGAAGLAAMRRAGATTLCQDESSCAVFGMPRAALELDPDHSVMAVTDIPRLLHSLTRGLRRTLSDSEVLS